VNILNYLRKKTLMSRIEGFKKLLNSPLTWQVLDELKIPGFGTYLVRFIFPVSVPISPNWGFGKPSHPQLEKCISKNLNDYQLLLDYIKNFAKDISKWNKEIDLYNPERPHLKNEFYPIVDTLVLYGILRKFQPTKYVEIGSGISTKIANQARNKGGFQMKIISIDPEPRAFVDSICDKVIRTRLEEVDTSLFADLSEGDILFFDGSHYCFPNNDVTNFFLGILPNLKSGVIIHIHDIYLPDDYPLDFLKFMWSEQYVLAAWLLGGSQGIKVLFPTAYMSKMAEMSTLIDDLINKINDEDINNSSWHLQGTSFWLVKV
jgi:hypothetical protein